MLAASGCARGASGPRVLRAGVLPIGSIDPLAMSSPDRAPSESLVRRQVFEGLTGYDAATLAVRPALALSWTASPDLRTFTFVLRTARFHDGSLVTPRDVVWSLARLAGAQCLPGDDPASAAPSALLEYVAGYADVCGTGTLPGVVGVGVRTVQITLTQPWADLPAALGNPAASIVPEGSRRTVGTGPYRVLRPWDGRSVSLERFDGWWGPAPAIARVDLLAYPDESAAYLDLVSGRLQVAPVPPARVADARRRFGDAGFVRAAGLYFFGFNMRSPRVSGREIREGLSLAVDRGSLATAVFKGTREPATGLWRPSSACDRICSFDLHAARAALSGRNEVVLSTSTLGPNAQAAHALARMFAAAGITARVVERGVREHLRGLAAGDADLFQLGIIPDYPTADGILWPLVRSSSPGNYMRYASGEVDSALTKARSTPDPDARAELLSDVERRVLSDVAVLPLLWYRSSVALDRRLRSDGPAVDGLGLIDVARLRFAA